MYFVCWILQPYSHFFSKDTDLGAEIRCQGYQRNRNLSFSEMCYRHQKLHHLLQFLQQETIISKKWLIDNFKKCLNDGSVIFLKKPCQLLQENTIMWFMLLFAKSTVIHYAWDIWLCQMFGPFYIFRETTKSMAIINQVRIVFFNIKWTLSIYIL